MMTMRHCTPFALVSILALCGCKPSICYFRAEPNVACRGTPVRLVWSASNGGKIVANPADPHVAGVDANGSITVAPRIPTRYRIYARNLWGTDQRDADVDVVIAPVEEKTIGTSIADPSMHCEDDILSVTVTPPPESWDAHIRAGEVTIAPRIARPYHVEHEDASADLEPGVRSTAFSALPVQGAWRISTRLQKGESCQHLPRNLMITVSTTCAP
jgi:hypothetical protein